MEENTPEYFEQLAVAAENEAAAATIPNESERARRVAAHYRKLAEQARLFGWPRAQSPTSDQDDV